MSDKRKKYFLGLLSILCFGLCFLNGCTGKPEQNEEVQSEVVTESENTVEELIYGESFRISAMPTDMEALEQEHQKEGMELHGWRVVTGMGDEVVAVDKAASFLDFLFTSTGGSNEVTLTPVYIQVGP